MNSDLAFDNLNEIVEKAKRFGITIMIIMEESQKTDNIIKIYKRIVEFETNVGITIQAHLHRSENDVLELLNYPGRIRIVKGAYEESPEVAIVRSKELTERYLSLVNTIVAAKHLVSIATYDEEIIQEVLRRKYT